MDINDRVARLERQNKWLKGGVAACVAVVCMAVVMGADKRYKDFGPFRMIKAQRFVVVDEAGNERGFLRINSQDKNSVELKLSNGDQSHTVGIWANDEGTGFSETNLRSQTVVSIKSTQPVTQQSVAQKPVATASPPIPSEAKQPSRLAPQAAPPQRTASPNSSAPSQKQLATESKRPSYTQPDSGRRLLRDSTKTGTKQVTSKTRSNVGKPLAAKSPTAQAPKPPMLPGLTSKNMDSGNKDDVANKPAVAKPAVTKPAVAKSSDAKPAVTKPAVAKSSDAKPAVAQKPTAVKKVKPSPKVGNLSLDTLEDFDTEGDDAEVNLIELAAQIAGTNMGLKAIESQLKDSAKWDITQLIPMVADLKQMCKRRNDLTLFRKMLDESDRTLVGALNSPRAAISQCSARIAEVRAQVEKRPARTKAKQRKADLQKLDSMSRELAKLNSD